MASKNTSVVNKPFAPMIAEAEANRLFAEYRETRLPSTRNKLIEGYQQLVRFNAEKIHVKLPDEVEMDDLTSAGTFGLMDAIERFDPGMGVKFTTYAAPRIRGAILDELRDMDWVPRLVRSRANKLDGATKQLEIELGRSPTDDELRGCLKVNDDELRKIQNDGEAVSLVSLSRKWFETDSNKDVREIDILEDHKTVDPARSVLSKDLKRLIGAGLSRAEFLIIVLYYFEEMTMKEIGKQLDLSESRVSQMHSSILKRLEARLTVDEGGGLRALTAAEITDGNKRPALRMAKPDDEADDETNYMMFPRRRKVPQRSAA